MKFKKTAFWRFFYSLSVILTHREGINMRKNEKEEKKENRWELLDPKVPVIRAGHMENRVQYGQNSELGVDKPGNLGL